MFGKIFTTNLSQLQHVHCDRRWLITRAGPDILTEGIERVKDLSPSPELFSQAQFWKQGIKKASWWPLYEAAFQEELRTREKREALIRLWKILQNGESVALACLCKDVQMCHRRLVGEELQRYGVVVEEFCIKPESKQLTLFE